VPESICIASANRPKRIKRAFDAVITIEDPRTPNSRRLRFHSTPHPPHLVLRFEDLDQPHERIETASMDHIQATLEFGREHRDAKLLVHCHAGIARSTAAALAIIADRLGAGRELDALRAMLLLQLEAVPNLLIISHADRLLDRGGRLLQVVTDWDAGLEWNQRRRSLNRQAVLSDIPA
jgi:predicted protein tyrosine phosphatase